MSTQQERKEYANMVNFFRDTSIADHKAPYLKDIKNRYNKKQKTHNLSDTDLYSIVKALNGVAESVADLDMNKIFYESFDKVAEGKAPKSNSNPQKDMDKLMKTLELFFEGADFNVNDVQKEVLKFYEDERINIGNIGRKKHILTEAQVKKLNNIFKNEFNDLPAARTAFANILTILPEIRKPGNLWKYKDWKGLKQGLRGYCSNIVGSFFEGEIAKALNNIQSIDDLYNLKATAVGGKNKKEDLIIKFEAMSKLESQKKEEKVVALNLKSYKLTRKSGISLHGTTINAIENDWRSPTKDLQLSRMSKILMMSDAKGFLKIHQNSISMPDTVDINKSLFKKSPKGDTAKNMINTLKNSMYFNADRIFGKEISFLMGKTEFIGGSKILKNIFTPEEFIDRLGSSNKGLTMSVSANENVDIVGFLAAEGGKI